MVSKLFTSLILLILAPRQVSPGTVVHIFSPDWYNPGSGYGGEDNCIPAETTTSHVTGVELGLTNTGALYTVNILGDGVTTRTVYPHGGCGSLSGSIETLSIPAGARVTKVEAWHNASYSW